MKQISKGKDRRVGVGIGNTDSDEWIVIEEQTSYTPRGHSKRKWQVDRISVSKEELAKIVAWYGPGRSEEVKTRNRRIYEAGACAGEHPIELSSYISGTHPEDNKQLRAVLIIEKRSDYEVNPRHIWKVRFEVRTPTQTETFSDVLDDALTFYNSIEPKGTKP